MMGAYFLNGSSQKPQSLLPWALLEVQITALMFYCCWVDSSFPLHSLNHKVRDEVCCPRDFLPASVQLFLQRGVLRTCDVPFTFSLEQPAFLYNMLGGLFVFSAWAGRGGYNYKLQLFEHMLVPAVVSCTQSEDHHLLYTAQLM